MVRIGRCEKDLTKNLKNFKKKNLFCQFTAIKLNRNVIFWIWLRTRNETVLWKFELVKSSSDCLFPTLIKLEKDKYNMWLRLLAKSSYNSENSLWKKLWNCCLKVSFSGQLKIRVIYAWSSGRSKQFADLWLLLMKFHNSFPLEVATTSAKNYKKRKEIGYRTKTKHKKISNLGSNKYLRFFLFFFSALKRLQYPSEPERLFFCQKPQKLAAYLSGCLYFFDLLPLSSMKITFSLLSGQSMLVPTKRLRFLQNPDSEDVMCWKQKKKMWTKEEMRFLIGEFVFFLDLLQFFKTKKTWWKKRSEALLQKDKSLSMKLLYEIQAIWFPSWFFGWKSFNIKSYD